MTGNYGDVILDSKPGFPAPVSPTDGNPLCQNGVYIYNDNGQDIRTPFINGLTSDDFQLNIDFYLTGFDGVYFPVFMAFQKRWIGLYVKDDGTLGVKYDNSNLAWSDAPSLSLSTWYSAQIKYETGVIHLFLDDKRILEIVVGELDIPVVPDFTTNDVSNGQALIGCIRNLVLINDTTISYDDHFFCDGFEDGSCAD